LSNELLLAAGQLIGLFIAVAGPFVGIAFLIGSKMGEFKDAHERVARKDEITRLSAISAQKDRQIEDLNRLLDTNQKKLESSSGVDQVVSRIERAKSHLSVFGNSVWTLESAKAPPIDPATPLRVITFSNNKGGVGKTTLSTNFAAYLNLQGYRVLCIDMDYQASMSATLLASTQTSSRAGVAPEDLQTAYSWLEDSYEPKTFLRNVTRLKPLGPKSFWLAESNYDLPTEEDRHLFRWMIGQANNDVRYRLRRLIWSEEVQQEFDFVVIDAPPKLSLGSVNALAASTHFVIPTMLDSLSSTPIRLLLASYKTLFQKLGIKPKLCGVAVTKTKNKALNPHEEERVEAINQMLAAEGTPARVLLPNIQFSVEFAKTAGQSLAIQSAYLRPQLTKLFDEIFKSIA
jgi:cellulose biosynthesis protein BcsQ